MDIIFKEYCLELFVENGSEWFASLRFEKDGNPWFKTLKPMYLRSVQINIVADSCRGNQREHQIKPNPGFDN